LVISIPNCRCDPKLSLRSISLTRQICCRDTSTRLTFDTRQQLGLLSWRIVPAFKMVDALENIESELNSNRTDG
ncbi:hypothetical protein, partial [Leptolyngbya sp. FACHB-16]|uniref:hypothetical protein n=1 Tax=unclassified Leptolyngbya TaxID=2650499 RepID=UPI001A7E9B0E